MNNRLIITFMLTGISLLSLGQSQPKTKSEVLAKTNSCTSNSSEIIGSQKDDFVQTFLRVGFKNDFVGTFGTTVHECLHGYDSDLSEGVEWDENTYPIAYFVDKDIVIRFAGRRLFKTEELHAEYFSADVKNLFRYGTYIHDKSSPSSASSNQWGFYGLLEEFNAYYHDVRAQIEFFTCSANDGPGDETFGNSMHAYFEFNIFMANYLKYAEEHHKEDYNYLKDNQEVRLAYTLIEMNWRNLLTEIMSSKNLANRMPSYKEEFRLFSDDLKLVMNEFMVSEDQLGKYKDFIQARPSDMEVVADNISWAEQLNLTGFGAGMSAEELTELYSDMENFELEFEERDPKLFYVVVLTTKSEEELMEVVFNNYPNFKKLGVIMDFTLNFSIYLDKFSSKAKAEKMLEEVKKQFPTTKIL